MFNSLLRIKPFLRDIMTLGKLTFAFITGSYRKLSKKGIAAILLGGIYLINPVDFVPDFLSIFGLVDDVAVIGFITYLMKDDLDAFRDWDKKEKSNEIQD